METFVCPHCKEDLPRSSYYRRGGNRKEGRSGYCKKCVLIITTLKQHIFKLKCLEYKGNKCQVCGYCKYSGALEFHHRNPKEKEFGFSKFRSQTFGKRAISELDKCDLLCSNCHREVHASLI